MSTRFHLQKSAAPITPAGWAPGWGKPDASIKARMMKEAPMTVTEFKRRLHDLTMAIDYPLAMRLARGAAHPLPALLTSGRLLKPSGGRLPARGARVVAWVNIAIQPIRFEYVKGEGGQESPNVAKNVASGRRTR